MIKVQAFFVIGVESSMATISVVFTLIGKMAITGSFSTIFLFTPELYPTNLRHVHVDTMHPLTFISLVVISFSLKFYIKFLGNPFFLYFREM